MAEDRRYRRYAVDQPVRAQVDGTEFEGHLRDISAGGAAVVIPSTVAFSNDQFVDLHMEGCGHRQGAVVRALPEGYALEFQEAEDIKKRIAEELERLHEPAAGDHDRLQHGPSGDG